MTQPSEELSPQREVEPLDDRLDGSVDSAARPAGSASLSQWLGLGWSATSVPVPLLLLTGLAVGPRGVGILSANTLAFLDAAVPFALAALGVLVGLSVGAHRDGDRRLIGVAVLEAGLTTLIVATGTALVAKLISAELPFWPAALTAGICAATSLTLPAGNPAEPGANSMRVVELDVLLAIVAGGLVLAVGREGSWLNAVSFAAQSCAVALLFAAAGWLLIGQASSDTEQRVLAIATLLLVGGAADYLSLSALLSGLVAGVFWQRAGGQARECIRRDALYVQHSSLVLILLVAGARVDWSASWLALALAYLLLRAAGKLTGAWLAGRIIGGAHVPRDLKLHLLPPGVFGVAFALNAGRAVGPGLPVVLTIAVAGTIGLELLARIVHRGEAVP
jgi:hypothetical protein